MNNLKNKNILISQLRLHDYAGSEVVTLELAEYFSSKGANVSIVTFSSGEPIRKEFEKINGLIVYKYGSGELSDYLETTKVDIMWVHHQLIPVELVRNPGDTKFIFHHMSPYAPLEFPLFWRIETTLADSILCNSQETMDKFIKDGIFAESDKRLNVFGNPAPDAFRGGIKVRKGTKLKRLLIVSNHPPCELLEVKTIIENKGITVQIFGSGSNNYRRVLPKDLANFDAVISIGKTVQYSILAGVPVYVYDRFGGPGYLQNNNYAKTKDFNFSGRGFEKKSAKVIAEELIKDYGEAVKFSTQLAERDEFLLSKSIGKVLTNIATEKQARKIDKTDILSYLYTLEALNTYTPKTAHAHNAESSDSSGLVQALRKTVLKKDRQIDSLNIQLERITGSNSYKVLRILTNLPRYIMRIIQLLFLQYIPDTSGLHRDDRSKIVGEFLDKYYEYKPKLSGLRVAVVARGMTSTPTSSFFIRLVSPLTVGMASRKVNLTVYDGKRTDIPANIDICIVQRTAFDDIETAKQFVKNIRENGTKLILDTDDAFSSLDPSHPEYNIQKRWAKAFNYMCKSTDKIWVSTNELLALNSKTTVYRNALDDRVWDFKQRKILTNKTIEIVYMGTMTHDNDLDLVLPAIEKINKKHPGSITLTVIGVARNIPDKPWLVSLQPPKNCRAYPAFVKWLQNLDERFDIGIAPLVDSEFNKAKSDIKVLDYLSMGVLPVVSDLLPYQDTELDPFVVRVGYSEGDWLTVLEDIVNNRIKYATLKEQARDAAHTYVRNLRSINQVAKKMFKDLRRINKL